MASSNTKTAAGTTAGLAAGFAAGMVAGGEPSVDAQLEADLDHCLARAQIARAETGSTAKLELSGTPEERLSKCNAFVHNLFEQQRRRFQAPK